MQLFDHYDLIELNNDEIVGHERIGSCYGFNSNYKTNQTFIGVKLGDVNWDWNPALARMASKSLPALPQKG